MEEKIVKPSEWQGVIEYALKLTHIRELPTFLAYPLGILLIVFVFVAVLCALVVALGKIKEVCSEKLLPLFYSPELAKKAKLRRRFAGYLYDDIVSKNRREDWRDEEYAELEAEVETEGRRRVRFFPFSRSNSGLRREKSLSRALLHSIERLILLEGDPGAGKSVALRHVAAHLLDKARHFRPTQSIIPLYINLKELRGGRTVDRNTIDKFIRSSINKINDRFVDDYISQEFDTGVLEGRWLFLFDSFDEISDVLSPTHSDDLIERYSTAIDEFMAGFNHCRAVVASRFYRGPCRKAGKSFVSLSCRMSVNHNSFRKHSFRQKLNGSSEASC